MAERQDAGLQQQMWAAAWVPDVRDFSIVAKTICAGERPLQFTSQRCHLLTEIQARCLSPLSPRFLICETEIMAAPTSWSRGKD